MSDPGSRSCRHPYPYRKSKQVIGMGKELKQEEGEGQ